MAAFSYRAMNGQGQTLDGVLEADSPRAARSALRSRQLVPLQVDPVIGAGAPSPPAQRSLISWLWPGRGRTLGSLGLSVWTRQLAGLTSAGLPLERALGLMADEAEDQGQRELDTALRAEISAGSSFAGALARHAAEFTGSYIAIIEAGEQSGQLGKVLDSLADDLDDQIQLRNKLSAATLYPAIVAMVALVIVVFLMAYVVPQIAAVFEGTRRGLPLLTRVMMGISFLLRDWGWLLLLLLAASGLVVRVALKQASVRLRFDTLILTLPILGRLVRSYNAARFARTLSLLAAAGVPILKAMHIAVDVLGNSALKRDAQQALQSVREGAPVATALAQGSRFPSILIVFTRLGEQTGELSAMLLRAATQLSADVQRRALRLATLLEPLLVVAMGLLVMLIVLAVLLPIIQLNQWVR